MTLTLASELARAGTPVHLVVASGSEAFLATLILNMMYHMFTRVLIMLNYVTHTLVKDLKQAKVECEENKKSLHLKASA